MALKDYHHTIQLGLQAVLREPRTEVQPARETSGRVAAIVFGSDRGLCGGFNRGVVDLAVRDLAGGKGGTSSSICS